MGAGAGALASTAKNANTEVTFGKLRDVQILRGSNGLLGLEVREHKPTRELIVYAIDARGACKGLINIGESLHAINGEHVRSLQQVRAAWKPDPNNWSKPVVLSVHPTERVVHIDRPKTGYVGLALGPWPGEGKCAASL